MAKVSMQSIANHFGISKVSVYKAIRNQPGVSKELRKKILAHAQKVGYIRSDSLDEESFLYIVDKRYFLSDEQFYTKIFFYLNQQIELNHGNLDLLIYDHSDNFLNRLKQVLPKSAIFLAGETDDAFMDALSDLDVPVITVDFISNQYDFDYLYINNYHSSMVATQYLVDKGHKDIGLICDIRSANSNTDRFYGFQKALLLNDIQYNPSWLIDKNIEQYSLDDFTLPGHLPTAFICHCDKAAQQLYLKLKMETDLTIGKDISVISFDNTELCEALKPKLTSVGLTSETIAQNAFELAKTRLSNRRGEKIKLSIYPEITIRDSIATLSE